MNRTQLRNIRPPCVGQLQKRFHNKNFSFIYSLQKPARNSQFIDRKKTATYQREVKNTYIKQINNRGEISRLKHFNSNAKLARTGSNGLFLQTILKRH